MRWSRRRPEPEEHSRTWTAPLRGPFETVKIHAPLAIELVAIDASPHIPE
jgi:hypothetical protein